MLSNNLVAVQGYDTVAYFVEGRAIPGSGNHVYRHEGITYIFATREHLNQFKEAPEKYIPQYGGFCAYAIAQGKKVVADPLAWKIVAGKLYLNLNRKVQLIWEKQLAEYIKEADEIWPNLKDQPFD